MATHFYSFFLFVYLLQLQLFRLLVVWFQNVSTLLLPIRGRFLRAVLTTPATPKPGVLYQNRFQTPPMFLSVYVAIHTKSWFGFRLPMPKNGFVVLFYQAKILRTQIYRLASRCLPTLVQKRLHPADIPQEYRFLHRHVLTKIRDRKLRAFQHRKSRLLFVRFLISVPYVPPFDVRCACGGCAFAYQFQNVSAICCWYGYLLPKLNRLLLK